MKKAEMKKMKMKEIEMKKMKMKKIEMKLMIYFYIKKDFYNKYFNIIDTMNKLYIYYKEHDHLFDFTKLLPSRNLFFTMISFTFPIFWCKTRLARGYEIL